MRSRISSEGDVARQRDVSVSADIDRLTNGRELFASPSPPLSETFVSSKSGMSDTSIRFQKSQKSGRFSTSVLFAPSFVLRRHVGRYPRLVFGIAVRKCLGGSLGGCRKTPVSKPRITSVARPQKHIRIHLFSFKRLICRQDHECRLSNEKRLSSSHRLAQRVVRSQSRKAETCYSEERSWRSGTGCDRGTVGSIRSWKGKVLTKRLS